MNEKAVVKTLRCTLSEAEINLRARDMARKGQEIERTEAEAKEVAADFKSRLSTMKTTPKTSTKWWPTATNIVVWNVK